jgi:hypothetical protein
MVDFESTVRFIPDWFPGAGFKRRAKEVGQKMSDIERVPFNWAKAQIVSSSSGSILCRFLIASRQVVIMLIHLYQSTFTPKTDSASIVRWRKILRGAAQRYILGAAILCVFSKTLKSSFTDMFVKVVSALISFFFLMAMNPSVQEKAQADIDRIAPNRLPTLDDYDSLPYIRAIIKEVMRWAPVAPLG